ncbi:MAG: sugar porter family MFS transporter [Actinomycetes bacterium]
MQGPVSAGETGPVAVEPVHTGRVVAVSLIAAMGGFLFGYDSSVINGANKAVFYQFQIANGFYQGFVVAIALLGSAVGAFIGGRLADRYGRKKVMVVAAILFLIAGIGTAFPISVYDFMLWRVVGGVAIGLAAVISPMYISEIAPAHLRGRLSSLFQLAIVIGIFSTQLVNQIILNFTSDTITAPVINPDVPPQEANNVIGLGLEAWQWMFICMVIPALIYWVLSLTLPESPRYLVAKDKSEQATSVLSQIYVNDVAPKIASIKHSLEGEVQSGMRDLKGAAMGLKPIVWIGIILAILQQFVGINAVFYYSNLIWAAVGFDESKAFLTSTVISAVNVVFTLVAIGFVDRIGRRPLLLIGSIGMFVTLGILTFIFQTAPKCTQAIIDDPAKIAGCDISADLNTPILNSTQGLIAVLSLNAFVAFFAATWGPVLWVMLGEMFPNRLRAAALSIAVMANWIANFIVSMTFPGLVQISLGLAYGLFTLFALLSFFYVKKYVKETKGIELEDMGVLEGVDA